VQNETSYRRFSKLIFNPKNELASAALPVPVWEAGSCVKRTTSLSRSGCRGHQWTLGIGILALTTAALGGSNTEEVVLTPRDIREQGIVALVGRTLELKAAVVWEYGSVKIPEDPRPMDTIAKEAGVLKVSFDGPGFEDIKTQKHFRADGEKLKKVAGADGREGYAFGDTPLTNGREYILKVRIQLRPSFKAEMLNNPDFVKQSNNPRYWSQTFMLDILAVR